MQEMGSATEEVKTEGSIPLNVNKWDGAAVKNALDDAVRTILTKNYHYDEIFTLIDIRLAICGIAVAASAFALLWDYLYPFPESRLVLITCALFYFLMMSILNFYLGFVEKSIFVKVLQRDPSGYAPDVIWEASSCLPKFESNYYLSLACMTAGHRYEKSFEKCISTFFDEDGNLVETTLEKEIAKLHSSLSSNKKNK